MVAILLLAAISHKEFVDEAAGLETIKCTNAAAEHVLSDLFNFGFIEALFSHDLFDEVSLLLTATPGTVAIGPMMTIGLVSVGSVMDSTVVGEVSVGGIWQIPDALNGFIHRFLQQAVEPAAFLFDLREIGQFGANGHRVLMRAEPWEA